MTGEKKSSDMPNRPSVKRSAKLGPRSSKSSSNAIITPPKAAIVASDEDKDRVRRRRTPLDAMLGRRHVEHAVPERVSSSTSTQGEARNIRIAELERALLLAKAEQDSLKEELEKARNEQHADRNIISDLRRRLAETRCNTTKPSSNTLITGRPSNEDDRLPEHTNDENIWHSHGPQHTPTQAQNESLLQDSSHHIQNSLHEGTQLNELRLRLHATEKELQERQQQLITLKSSVSSLTRSDSQTTDGELVEVFSQLANSVREWVISNFRRSRPSFDNVPVEIQRVLESIVPSYTSVDAVYRIALYQAIVSGILMQLLEEPLIIGLSDVDSLGAIRQCAETLRSERSEYHEWRRVTIRTLELSTAKVQLQQGRRNAVHRTVHQIEHSMHVLTSISLTASAQLALVCIVDTAADLQRTLALQKAHYQLLFFRNQEGNFLNIDDRRMEPINDLDMALEDGRNFTAQMFRFCVFPCLEKFGDEWGEHLETKNVLLKAKICCG